MTVFNFFRFLRAIRRIRRIISIFVKHGFYQIITTLGLSRFFIFRKYLQSTYPVEDFQNIPPEIRLRYALEELGPTFIKVGQILSQEVTSLPAKYVAELRKLQDTVQLNYVKFEEIKQIIKRELRKDIEEIFESFEESPIASASIAQVHRAFLKDGTMVAVKIKKPDAEKLIRSDLNVLFFLVGIIKGPVKEFMYIENIEELYREFSKNLMAELNFLNEAGYTEKIRVSSTDKDTVEIPRVHWAYTTNNIIVEDFIEGFKVSDRDEIEKRGYDPIILLKIFLNHFFKQIFILGYFNADPHQGNVFIINQNKIAIIDFGAIGILTKEIKKMAMDYFINFLNARWEDSATLFIEICKGDLSEKGEQSFRFEYIEFVETFFNKPFKEIYSSEILMHTLKIGQKHGMIIPSELTQLFKALLAIESIAKGLDPDFSFSGSGLEFFNFEALIDRKERARDVKEVLLGDLKHYRTLIGEFPRKLEKILKKMAEDTFAIDFIHKGLEGFIGEVEKSGKRLRAGLLISSLIISSSILVFVGGTVSKGWIEVAGFAGWVIGFIYIIAMVSR